MKFLKNFVVKIEFLETFGENGISGNFFGVKNGFFLGKVWGKKEFLQLCGFKIEYLEILWGEKWNFIKFGIKWNFGKFWGENGISKNFCGEKWNLWKVLG